MPATPGLLHPTARRKARGRPPTLTLNPGEGAFFQSPTNWKVAFTGTPHVPVLPISLPGEASYLLSRQTNDIGNFENIIGTYPPEATTIYQWDPIQQQYVTNEFVFGSWVPGPAEPRLAIGEAAWISSAGGIPPAITVPPIILAQPSNLVVQLGDPATLAVTVASPELPAYQWFFNSFPIPGATNSSFTIGSVQTNNLGAYNVIVTNSTGRGVQSGDGHSHELGTALVLVSPNGSNCCWSFSFSQTNGAPGDITSITATFAAGNVPGIEFFSASGPFRRALTLDQRHLHHLHLVHTGAKRIGQRQLDRRYGLFQPMFRQPAQLSSSRPILWASKSQSPSRDIVAAARSIRSRRTRRRLQTAALTKAGTWPVRCPALTMAMAILMLCLALPIRILSLCGPAPGTARQWIVMMLKPWPYPAPVCSCSAELTAPV